MNAPLISTILVANRGEIACRIIRSIHRLGKRAVAVYSSVDRGALHVHLADQAVFIGEATPTASYLNIESLLRAARETNCNAVHPGYGFLSENAEFARRCREAGLIFIGPSPEAIGSMGSKSEAKALMEEAGVPLMPGYHGSDQTDAKLVAEAERIGFPILIKAVSGGGGRGMRIVQSPTELLESIAAARRESAKAFGDDRVLLERYFPRARHVEVQILGDSRGAVTALFERDCSMQRRHQKVLEEAPAPLLSEETRTKLARAAVQAGEAVRYQSAGTVEFLVDPDQNIYFMEMNTRLQVEHPVTEMITGIDLVAAQIKIAEGGFLSELALPSTSCGHAIEARVYAEDTAAGFLPASGTLVYYHEPITGPYLRIDSGVRLGDTISSFYDSMIAKVIAYGSTREEARQRLIHALEGFHVGGIATNRSFLLDILASEIFKAENLSTTGLASLHAARKSSAILTAPELCAIHALWAQPSCESKQPLCSPWHALRGFTTTVPLVRRISCIYMNQNYDFLGSVTPRGGTVLVDGVETSYQVESFSHDSIIISIADRRHTYFFARSQSSLLLFSPHGQEWTVHEKGFEEATSEETFDGTVYRAPMTGTVIRTYVTQGSSVHKGTPLLVIEAMKMEHTVAAAQTGLVAQLTVKEGELVQQGEVVVEVDPNPAS